METMAETPNHPLFAGLPPDVTQRLLLQLRLKRYRAGAYIFNTGQPATCLFLLVEGLVRVGYIAPDGDYRILDICEAGDIFGEMFMGDYRFRIGQAQAMRDVCVYMVSEEELHALIQQYPPVAVAYIQHLSDSKRRAFAHLHALQRSEARARLLGTLLSLARKMCCSNGEEFVLHPAITQQDLADMTGLNRSTVSSIINRLRDDGILGGSGRSLTMDVPRMEALLQDEGFELVE